MDIVLWVLAGSAIGWAGFAMLGLNEARGMVTSLIIGAVGGFVGGNVLSPMLSGTANLAGAFDFLGLFIAAVCAAACLIVGNLVYKRFEI